jgi:hypothetical protein
LPSDLAIPPPELFPERPAWVVRADEDGRALDVMAWGFPHKVLGTRIDKATSKPVLLNKSVTNVRNHTSPLSRSTLMNP